MTLDCQTGTFAGEKMASGASAGLEPLSIEATAGSTAAVAERKVEIGAGDG